LAPALSLAWLQPSKCNVAILQLSDFLCQRVGLPVEK
jgi:hypothetical protein